MCIRDREIDIEEKEENTVEDREIILPPAETNQPIQPQEEQPEKPVSYTHLTDTF